MSAKPHAPACDRNRDPILAVLREAFRTATTVLEIGSGTGQHAVYFGAALPHVHWLATDLPQHHAGMRLWLDEAALPNVSGPLALDVGSDVWPVPQVDGMFTANTLHIMGWDGVEALFRGVGRHLQPGGVLAIYGPFNYEGRYTAPSNAAFDASLRARDPASGLRDFEAVAALAAAQGLFLVEDVSMPANNRMLVWRRGAAA